MKTPKYYRLPVYHSPIMLQNQTREYRVIEQKKVKNDVIVQYFITQGADPVMAKMVSNSATEDCVIENTYDSRFSKIIPKHVKITTTSKTQTDTIDIEIEFFTEEVSDGFFTPQRINLRNDTTIDVISKSKNSQMSSTALIFKDGESKKITQQDIDRLTAKSIIAEMPKATSSRSRFPWMTATIVTLFTTSAVCAIYWLIRRKRVS
jgi:hypothetical protein